MLFTSLAVLQIYGIGFVLVEYPQDAAQAFFAYGIAYLGLYFAIVATIVIGMRGGLKRGRELGHYAPWVNAD